MLVSGCPPAQRAACQECAEGHVCSRTVKRRVQKKFRSTSLEYRNFIPSNKRQLIFRNLIFQAPVFCQTAKKTRWITKFCCSEARKPTATSCQVQRLTFAMQFWAQLLRLIFFSSFTSARLSLQTGFREKPMSRY